MWSLRRVAPRIAHQKAAAAASLVWLFNGPCSPGARAQRWSSTAMTPSAFWSIIGHELWPRLFKINFSMDFSRPEYWSGHPFPSPGDLPNPGIKPRSPALWADSLPAEPPGKPQISPSIPMFGIIPAMRSILMVVINITQFLSLPEYSGIPTPHWYRVVGKIF